MENERHNLGELDPLDRWLVVLYWRFLYTRRKILTPRRRLPFRAVPLPVKLAFAQFAVLTALLLAAPVLDAPAVQIPAIWITAYCAAVALAPLFPRRQVAHYIGR